MGYVGSTPVNGDYSKLDDISSGFNGIATAFTLQVGSVNATPPKETTVIISVGGILQEPVAAYTISASTITFTSAPAAGAGFFGMLMGDSYSVGLPAAYADGTITEAKMAANSVNSDQYVDGSIDNEHIANGTIAMSKTALTAGTGLTLATNDLSVDASQAQITTLANVVTVGTIGTGTWEATDVGVAHGGTGASTAADGFDALAPMTAAGDIIYGGVSGTGTRLAAGSNAQVLTLASGVPSWATAATYSDAQAVLAVEAETTLVLSSGMTATNAVLTTPALGTPTALTLTSATGLPAAGVVGTASTLSGVQTLTGTKTLNGTSSTLGVVLLNAAETTTITATVPPATVNFDAATQSVLVYTTNANATWITNLRFSSGTTMDAALAVGQSLSVTLMAAQGGTAYLGTTFKIDGTTVTPLWQGGIPTAAGASGTDVYTYTITKTASATYRVLASMSSFK